MQNQMDETNSSGSSSSINHIQKWPIAFLAVSNTLSLITLFMNTNNELSPSEYADASEYVLITAGVLAIMEIAMTNMYTWSTNRDLETRVTIKVAVRTMSTFQITHVFASKNLHDSAIKVIEDLVEVVTLEKITSPDISDYNISVNIS